MLGTNDFDVSQCNGQTQHRQNGVMAALGGEWVTED